MGTMRAKMRVSAVHRVNDEQENLKFHAVCANEFDEHGLDENNTFARYTPSAELSVTVMNPALIGQFQEGEEYYVDFTPAL